MLGIIQGIRIQKSSNTMALTVEFEFTHGMVSITSGEDSIDIDLNIESNDETHDMKGEVVIEFFEEMENGHRERARRKYGFWNMLTGNNCITLKKVYEVVEKKEEEE